MNRILACSAAAVLALLTFSMAFSDQPWNAPLPSPAPTSTVPAPLCSEPCGPAPVCLPPQKICVEMAPPEVIIKPAAASVPLPPPSPPMGFIQRCGHWLKGRHHHHHHYAPQMMPMQAAPMAVMPSYASYAVQSQAIAPAVSYGAFAAPVAAAPVAVPAALPTASFAVQPMAAQPLTIQALSIDTSAFAPQAAPICLQPTTTATPTMVLMAQPTAKKEPHAVAPHAVDPSQDLNQVLSKLTKSVDLLTKLVDKQTAVLIDHHELLKRHNTMFQIIRESDPENKTYGKRLDEILRETQQLIDR